MEEKSNNANISPAKLLGKLKIILKLAITENCRVSWWLSWQRTRLPMQEMQETKV